MRGRQYIEIGKLYMAKGDAQSALAEFKKAYEVSPDDEQSFFELGKCHFIMGEYEAARVLLTRIGELNAGNINAGILLAKTYKMTGNYYKAREIFESIAKFPTNNKEISSELAEINERINTLKQESSYNGVCVAPALAREFPVITKGLRASIEPYRVCCTWFINNKCNYRCSYCQNAFNEPDNFKVLSSKEWFLIWKKLYDQYGTISLQITGGEPGLYPDFFPLLKELSRLHHVELQTNLSWDPQQLIAAVDSRAISRVGASYHQEFDNFENFLNKMKMLRDAGFKIEISYVGYPPFLKNGKKHALAAHNEGIQFTVLSYQGKYKGKRYPESYSSDEIELINELNSISGNNKVKERAKWDLEHKIIVEKNEENENIKKMCRMGQMYTWIQADGSSMRCCKSPVSLGNIITGSFKLLDDAESCSLENCICFRSMVVGEEKRWERNWTGTGRTAQE